MKYIAYTITFLITLTINSKYCHSESTYYYRSWSSSTTTRIYSKPTNKKYQCVKSPTNAPCPLKSSDEEPTIKKIGNGTNDNNCVLYLREQRGIRLPSKNLSSFSSKVSIINSHLPSTHSVAIIKTPGKNSGIGHLAEVVRFDKINGKAMMLLYEANNPTRGYYERTITGDSLEEIQKKANIVGYYIEPDQIVEAQESYKSHLF